MSCRGRSIEDGSSKGGTLIRYLEEMRPVSSKKLTTTPVGHPQTCVYPDVCLGIAHVSGKLPLSGQGVL